MGPSRPAISEPFPKSSANVLELGGTTLLLYN